MHVETVSDFRRAVRMGPYAWPGGYAVMMATSDGGTLCAKCASTERRNIADSISTKANDGWRVVGVFTMADVSSAINCDHCGAYFSTDE